ncbi:hypothetical protein BCR35DRAFT_121880 [Leucosporidium creatinivorum]|uniref:Uncharacterized protein n=1 Tax=Leucosporidium creatinivorum TaxID=106004 RepID=A0A1Y2EXD6_9BASI|nr:hypothetical protein BCR35DRAFT_121880 [Leucosporidium creatinivorum]
MERKLIRGEWVVHARLDLIHNRATRQCKARTKFIEARQYMIKQGVWEETVDEVLWKTAIRVRPCCKEALDVLEGVGRCFALEGCERCGEMREVAHIAWGRRRGRSPRSLG